MYLCTRQMNGSIIKEVRDQKKEQTKSEKAERTNLYESTQFSSNIFSLDLDLQRSKARDAFAYPNKIECITK